jgi:Putative metallopeptidase
VFAQVERWLIGLGVGVAILTGAMLLVALAATPDPAKSDRIVIDYMIPTNPALKPIYDILRDKKALERLRELLLPVQWPRTLRLELRDCQGESNAGYDDAAITVCYELLDDFWRSAADSGRPSVITREEAFVGQSLNVFLHEAAHALFRLFKIPVLGREEDAADQLSGYFLLQLPNEKKRNLVLGSAYAFASELKIRSPRDLNRPRLEIGRHVTFADEHGTLPNGCIVCFASPMDRTRSFLLTLSRKDFFPRSGQKFAPKSTVKSISPTTR